MTRPGERAFPFTVNCNTPFSYRLEAQYGALTNSGALPAATGLVAAIPYDVGVHIPTDGAPIEDRCPGDSLAAGRVRCPFSSSGNNIALGSHARLTVTWTPQGRAPLAGDYVERLTIRVATSL